MISLSLWIYGFTHLQSFLAYARDEAWENMTIYMNFTPTLEMENEKGTRFTQGQLDLCSVSLLRRRPYYGKRWTGQTMGGGAYYPSSVPTEIFFFSDTVVFYTVSIQYNGDR